MKNLNIRVWTIVIFSKKCCYVVSHYCVTLLQLIFRTVVHAVNWIACAVLLNESNSSSFAKYLNALRKKKKLAKFVLFQQKYLTDLVVYSANGEQKVPTVSIYTVME